MNISTRSGSCFLAEWYGTAVDDQHVQDIAARLTDSAAAVTSGGEPVRLLAMLAVPTDEVVFGVFVARDAAHVQRTCLLAGAPAARLTAAVNTPLAGQLVGKPLIPGRPEPHSVRHD